MADPKRPAETPAFETDTVQADRAREQGLGLGERELKAQRDPGGVRTANEDTDIESMDAEAQDAVDASVGVQGAANDEGARGRGAV